MKPPGIHFRFSPFAFGFFLLLGLALGRPASADPLYQNYADLNYVIPGYPPPMIDGKNYVTPAFDNEGQFDVTFAVLTANPEYYEAWNMLYYTNNGTMLADSSFSTIGLYEVGYSPGCGFRFDLQTTNVISRTMADTFTMRARFTAIRCWIPTLSLSAFWANASCRRPMSSIRAWSKSAPRG
jgi:hypothetical protein